MACLRVENLTKVFPKDVWALRDVSLDLGNGERVALLGAPGSGKTTLVRMVAGLDEIPEGRIFLRDEDITDLPPARRSIATLFHNYALYPHLTVYRSLGYGLRLRGVTRDELDRRVREAAQLLELADVLDRKPDTLSGDQRQRIALGRSLVAKPTLWLLDEPFLDLDPQLRQEMQARIVRLQETLSMTMLFVTRDPAEALAVGQRLVVLDKGVVQQVATPQELREAPANRVVADLLGIAGGGENRVIIPGRAPRK